MQKYLLIADLTKVRFKSLFEKSEVKFNGKKIKNKNVIFPEPQLGKAKSVNSTRKVISTSFTYFFNGQNKVLEFSNPYNYSII